MLKDTEESCIGLRQWFMPVIPGLGGKKWKDLEREVCLVYLIPCFYIKTSVQVM